MGRVPTESDREELLKKAPQTGVAQENNGIVELVKIFAM